MVDPRRPCLPKIGNPLTHFDFRRRARRANVAPEQPGRAQARLVLSDHMKTSYTVLCVCLAGAQSWAVAVVPEQVRPAVADRQAMQTPDRDHLTGWIGDRMAANEGNRLVKLDPTRLLEGYRHRPGRQAWDGEHVGKWLHAATLAWANTGDAALRQKLDYVAAELVKCQLEDGYLGTYVPKDRWTEWDVWAHKYNLIGLITYMRYTGNLAPLPACRRMGDLLCRDFGDTPGKRDIIKAGYHVGLAPTSVLEPMVLLYRLTGEPRYLDFCKYILRAWEQPDGPKVISTLLTLKRVDKVGNGKAYEMLSCLNGALEYYRTVGDPKILQACLNAWDDIVRNRLYITGAASYGELFHGDYDLPNVNNVGETCVTVTWLQFNAQLLRLTGEARFAEQLEHVILNQLFGAQRCDGAAWGYYVQMEGKKPYSSTLDGHCCLSSGPRGVALIPTFAWTTDAEGLVLNLYDSGTANLALADQSSVKLTLQTTYPGNDHIHISVEPEKKKSFSIKLRIPAWCRNGEVTVNGKRQSSACGPDGYLNLRRTWRKGDRIDLRFPLEPQVVVGDHKNAGKIAVLFGPLVLAADTALLGSGNADSPALPLKALAAAGPTLDALEVTPEPAPENVKTWPGAEVFRIRAVRRGAASGGSVPVRLIPFADAGGTGSDYKVWLPVAGDDQPNGNLLLEGKESRSRHGNANGSINDEDFQSLVVTFNGKPAGQDWFAVSLEQPVTIGRVVFTHGNNFHDGGWFDTTQSKPQVQVRRTEDGPWETVGQLDSYPTTTPTSCGSLHPGDHFVCQLKPEVKACAVRVIGTPASGDNSQQAFSSCAELEAFAR